MGDDLGAEPVLREDGGAAVGLTAGGLGHLGHGDLRELLLQRVRDDLVVVDRVDPDLGEGRGIEEGASAVGRSRWWGIEGGARTRRRRGDGGGPSGRCWRPDLGGPAPPWLAGD